MMKPNLFFAWILLNLIACDAMQFDAMEKTHEAILHTYIHTYRRTSTNQEEKIAGARGAARRGVDKCSRRQHRCGVGFPWIISSVAVNDRPLPLTGHEMNIEL